MKQHLKKYSILFLLSYFLLIGCNDAAFLREDPETFYTIDNIFHTSEQVQQVITTCYHRVRNIYCPFNNNAMLNVWSYRMGNGTDVFDVPTIRYDYRFNDYSILSSQSSVYYSVYSEFYYLIMSANTALYAAEKSDIVWDSPEVKAKTIAEARFFRAFAYRNLGELFGGVPIVTEMAKTPRYDYERATRLETYQFAIDEIEAILNDLPVTTSVAGKLVRGVAQHNLCQLYIDKGVVLEEDGGDAAAAYAKAITYANDVIDSGTYHLMTERFGSRKNENPDYYFATSSSMQTDNTLYSSLGYNAEGNVYWDLFQEGNQDYQQGNREAIWVAQSDYELSKEEGEKLSLMYPGIYGPVFRDQGVHILGNMEDVGGLGMCQVTPTFYTRDDVYSNKWAHDMRNSESVFRRIFYGNVPNSEYYGKAIPWDVLYRKKDGAYTDAPATLLYPISCKIATDKFTGIDDGENMTRLFRGDYLLRLPETILLRAEAKWRTNDNAGAASDINQLRSRAKCSYLVTTEDVSLELILDERTRELVYEESRWNTLLRMGGNVATERIKKYAYWDYPRKTLTKEFNLWPIPQTVIDTNKDVKLEQNKGW